MVSFVFGTKDHCSEFEDTL